MSWAKSVGYWFDSSASSKQKDETLGKMAESATGTGSGNGAGAKSIPAKDVSVVAEGDVNVTKEPSGV